MHVTLAAALLLAATTAAPPVDDAQVAKGLRNIAQIHAVAQVLELRRTAKVDRLFELPSDAWGKPFRLEGERIVSAGSDGVFETVDAPYEQFEGLAGDLIFANGGLYRSNRNWLYTQVKPGSDSAAALTELRTTEVMAMMMRMPAMRNVMISRLTVLEMQRPGATTDGWGTPIRVEGTKLISAGADQKFDPASWDKAPALDLNEDIVIENGTVTRGVDLQAFVKASPMYGIALAQPPDPKLDRSHLNVGSAPKGEITPPVVVTRVEPKYTEDYRKARISGVVIVEAAILTDGSVEKARIVKSAAPDLDMAALDAVRQWKFEPAKRGGQVVPVQYNLTINFTLR